MDWMKTLLLQLCALPKFHVIDGPNTRIRFRVKEDPNASDLIVLLIPVILSGSSNECWLRICDACVITTWA